MLANLTLTELFYYGGEVAGAGVALETIVTTRDLPSDASYAMELKINDMSLRYEGVTDGAGEAFADFTEFHSTWYPTEGEHIIEVWLDVDNQIEETNEHDNYQRLTFTPADPALDQKFLWPFGGEAGKDYVINGYHDINPGGVVQDHRGYDNGNSNSSSLSVSHATNQGVDQEIPVYAIADGVVTQVQEGENDRYTPGKPDERNYIRIQLNNENDLSVFHDSLRRDSMTHQVGDEIKRGDLLGYMAGRTSSRHAGSTVIFYSGGRSLNPFIAPDVYWESQPAYPHDESTVAASWVTNTGYGFQVYDGPSEFRTFHPDDGSEVIVGTRINGVEKDEVINFEWRTPSGDLFFEDSETQPWTRHHDDFASFTNLPVGAELGTWTVSIIADGVVQKVERFEVTEDRFPEIRVEENHNSGSSKNLVTDGRYSPYNLGSADLSSQGPSYEYEISNHGTETLYLFRLDVPEGFFASEIPDMLFPGESATIDITLDTNYAGYRVGDVRIHSDDPDEGIFSFAIEGAVLDSGSQYSPDYFTIGMNDREVLEGNSLTGNVRIPENTDEPLTVELEYQDSTVTGPATVVIPAGQRSVYFQVNVAENLIRSDYYSSISATLLVPDAPNHAVLELHVLDAGEGLEGTEGDDEVVVTLGINRTISVNGIEYDFGSQSNFDFDMLGGDDTLILVDELGDDTVTLRPGTVKLVGAFDFNAFNVENVIVEFVGSPGQGVDHAEVYGADGADVLFRTAGDRETLVGGGFDYQIIGSERTKAYAEDAGTARGEFFDTTENETFSATPEWSYFARSGKVVTTRGFDELFAFSNKGGNDTALLNGSVRIDEYVSNLTLTNVKGEDYEINVNGFDRVITKMFGGGDVGVLLGTEVDEKFYANQEFAFMRTDELFSRVDGLDVVKMYSGGGEDRVIVEGSTGDDIFYSNPVYASLKNDSLAISANAFSHVIAIASEGNDVAILADSSNDDRFVARPTVAWLTGANFFNHVIGFNEVSVTSSGGDDRATFYGSALDDRINASAAFSLIRGEGFFNRANGFRNVAFEMWQGGMDFATFSDSEFDDEFVGDAARASIYSDSYFVSAVGIDSVVAISNAGGEDGLFKGTVSFELIEVGDWN